MPMATSSTEGPRLIRPIPRRPFGPSPTSTSDDASCPGTPGTPGTPTITAHDIRFLESSLGSKSSFRGRSSALSRGDSMINLTAPTLYGIYSPITGGQDPYADGQQTEPPSPWGMGAETPVTRRARSVDREMSDEQEHGLLRSRRKSSSAAATASDTPSPSSPFISTWTSSLVFRSVLLFSLGVGYGAMVTQLPSKQNLSAFGVDELATAGLCWEYLAFWGATGVVLGRLLPWIDGMWDGTTSEPTGHKDPKESGPESDWALVVRGIGCFVGIVFAIRRLPWTSTSQVTLALGLTNPLLWYLIDRSKAGFIVSAVVGLAGSVVLLALNPQMVSTPMGPQWVVVPVFPTNFTASGFDFEEVLDAIVSVPEQAQNLVETGTWIFSVLFLSSLCLGNIGRRLALNSTAATRGRWGGLR